MLLSRVEEVLLHHQQPPTFKRQSSWFPAAGDVCWSVSNTKKVKVGWNKAPGENTASLRVWALQKVREMVKESSLQATLSEFCCQYFSTSPG